MKEWETVGNSSARKQVTEPRRLPIRSAYN